MVKVKRAIENVANVLSGADSSRPISPDYLDVNSRDDLTGEVYFVTYGPYNILPSFDPNCLIALVSAREPPHYTYYFYL